jgi:8-oxo-dGTP diphosphatase
MEAPQFGESEAGRTYVDRPAAFGIVERAGFIAAVRIKKPGHAPWIDLPGGALDEGEDAAVAVVREFGEETGLKVEPRAEYARADQFFLNTDDRAFNNRGVFFALDLVGENAALKIEEDHTLEWMAPTAALSQIRHGAHAWAIAAWLRARP